MAAGRPSRIVCHTPCGLLRSGCTVANAKSKCLPTCNHQTTMFRRPLGPDYRTLHRVFCKMDHAIRLAQGSMQHGFNRLQPSRSDQAFTLWTMGIVMAHCPVGNQSGGRAWVFQMDPMAGMRHRVGSTLGKAQVHRVCDVSELDVPFPRDQLYR